LKGDNGDSEHKNENCEGKIYNGDL
jgi:hypothetical protein